MSDEIDITQRSGKESVQIGIQNNYNTYSDSAMAVDSIVSAAFAIFREQYPKLRDEALAEVQRLVEERVATFDRDSVITPRPKIVADVLQNASTTEETAIREMYAKVLSGDMNKSQRRYIHPAYPEIIKQLCVEEAKILQRLKEIELVPTITLSLQNNQGEQSIIEFNLSDILEKNDEGSSLYFENLQRLGLVIPSKKNQMLKDKQGYVDVLQHPYTRKRIVEASAVEGNETLIIAYGFMRLTDFGKAFCDICLPPKEVLRSQKHD